MFPWNQNLQLLPFTTLHPTKQNLRAPTHLSTGPGFGDPVRHCLKATTEHVGSAAMHLSYLQNTNWQKLMRILQPFPRGASAAHTIPQVREPHQSQLSLKSNYNTPEARQDTAAQPAQPQQGLCLQQQGVKAGLSLCLAQSGLLQVTL